MSPIFKTDRVLRVPNIEGRDPVETNNYVRCNNYCNSINHNTYAPVTPAEYQLIESTTPPLQVSLAQLGLHGSVLVTPSEVHDQSVAKAAYAVAMSVAATKLQITCSWTVGQIALGKMVLGTLDKQSGEHDI